MDEKDIKQQPKRLPKIIRVLLYYKKTILFTVIGLSIATIAFCVSYKIITDDISKINLFDEPLIAYSRDALSGKVKSGDYAFFGFRETQLNFLEDFYQNNETTAVAITIAVPKLDSKKANDVLKTPQPFYYGFLHKSDYKDERLETKRAIKEKSLQKILSGTDLRAFIAVTNGDERNSTLLDDAGRDGRFLYFDISFALERGLDRDGLPRGFFVNTAFGIKVTNIRLEKARLGLDLTGKTPFFGVAPNGGSFGSPVAVDFTGGVLVYPTTNSEKKLMPKVIIAYQNNNKGESDGGDWRRAFPFNIAGYTYSVYKAAEGDPSLVEITVQSSLLKMPFSKYESKSKTVNIKKIIMCENDKSALSPNECVLSPLPTDVGLITTASMEKWRSKDYELFEWDRFHNVLIFDTRNYHVQRDFFRRMAFFCEKKGYRGKILTDEQLGAMHGYNAHDYSARSIAKFFTAVDKKKIKITEKENLLRDIALHNGLIEKTENGYKELTGAVISISQESPLWLRRNLANHELWHGLYFTDEDFQKKCAEIYDDINDKSRAFVTGYWASQDTLGYDQNDDDLLRNELMAYIMQQSKSNVAPYFVHLANRGSVMAAIPRLCEWVRENDGAAFTDIAKTFDEYARSKWHLNCGRAGMIYQ